MARANYLAMDRPEIQFATKECARSMSKPTIKGARRLKRLRRYLKGHLRTTHRFPFQAHTQEMTVHTDANWAGDKKSRKSTSGGSIRIGQHLIKTWSKSQSLIAFRNHVGSSHFGSRANFGTRSHSAGLSISFLPLIVIDHVDAHRSHRWHHHHDAL